MVRWQPGTAERLRRSALKLYAERGFEATTAAAIAVHAGLTERTFFRHFADKREVLFGGTEALEELMIQAVDDAPGSATPMQTVTLALEAAGKFFETSPRTSERQRQAIINANPALYERELVKLASLATSLATALRRRGLGETAARLAAEAGISTFRVTFERWVGDELSGSFTRHARQAVAQFQAITGSAPTPTSDP